MPQSYRTLKGCGASEIIINKSRFLSYAERVETEEAALAFLNAIKKRHWDATHNCSAYILGPRGDRQKSDDDGKPGGTAGKPILEALRKNQLQDAIVVVTRYFGGVKLGAGGLIRAYTKAALTGIEAAGLARRALYAKITIKIGYPLLGSLENYLRNHNYSILEKTFSDQVIVCVLAKKEAEEELIQQLIANTSGQAIISKEGELYLDEPD